MDTVRLFIAIALPERLLEQLALVQRQLERQMPAGSVRWVRPEATHLTLKFLGETSAQRLPQIEQALAQVSRHAHACEIEAGGLGCFPNPRRPRVVWIGLTEPTGRLVALQQSVEEALDVLGYPAEGRAFTAHLTLGRVQERAASGDVRRIGEVVSGAEVGVLGQFRADDIHLIRSVLKPSGAEYTILKTFPLQRP